MKTQRRRSLWLPSLGRAGHSGHHWNLNHTGVPSATPRAPGAKPGVTHTAQPVACRVTTKPIPRKLLSRIFHCDSCSKLRWGTEAWEALPGCGREGGEMGSGRRPSILLFLHLLFLLFPCPFLKRVSEKRKLQNSICDAISV
uniref:Uncharacterized protein n=1 Tax=Myotis myotis TaxID=51298 RepID=A0A7J7T632_MYOMY|nr:hypothetical protein mMyoMyo1_009224 [Myotis myotis]